MRLIVLARCAKNGSLVATSGNAARIGEIDQRRLGGALGSDAVALQLDVEPVAEQPRAAPRSASAASCALPGAIAASSGPPGPPVSAIRPSVSPSSQASLRCGCSFGARFEEGARVEPHQAAVAVLARRQQHDARAAPAAARRRSGLLVAEIDRQRSSR